ncbi:MAG: hypothetical protein IJP89_09830 [Synergistaceae bacterium]|nr:hypothetical protein [Synergistaceae bacterium]
MLGVSERIMYVFIWLKYCVKNILVKIYCLLCVRSKTFTTECDIACLPEQVQYKRYSTCHIVYYDNGERRGYLRLCRVHEQPRKYVDSIVCDYCEYAGIDEHRDELRRIIADKLNDDSNLRKFFHMGVPFGRKYPKSATPYAKFLYTKDASLIGLEGSLPEWFAPRLVNFARFATFPIHDYQINAYLKEGQYHTYFSGRTKAYEAVAELVGVSWIVPKSRYICLNYGEKSRVGISIDVADGVPTDSLADIRITPSFQRELSILNMLDVICFQRDHKPDSYFVKTDKYGAVCGLSAFDNDEPGAFIAVPTIRFTGYDSQSPFVDRAGHINRPYLDSDISLHIMSITPEDLHNALSPYISGIEVMMCAVRLKRLTKAVKKSVEAGTTKLLGYDEWTYETIAKELNGKYGMTYLKCFVEKYKARTV